MTVRINIPYLFRHLTDDVDFIDIEGTTLGECLHALVKKIPSLRTQLFDDEGKLLEIVDVYINKESSYPEELLKPVNDGDEIHISLVLVGG